MVDTRHTHTHAQQNTDTDTQTHTHTHPDKYANKHTHPRGEGARDLTLNRVVPRNKISGPRYYRIIFSENGLCLVENPTVTVKIKSIFVLTSRIPQLHVQKS